MAAPRELLLVEPEDRGLLLDSQDLQRVGVTQVLRLELAGAFLLFRAEPSP